MPFIGHAASIYDLPAALLNVRNPPLLGLLALAGAAIAALGA